MRLATCQQDGKKTAFSICDRMDFRVAAAARASNRLVLVPLYGWPAPTERELLNWQHVIHEGRSHGNRDTRH
jgi:hypothetical protein